MRKKRILILAALALTALLASCTFSSRPGPDTASTPPPTPPPETSRSGESGSDTRSETGTEPVSSPDSSDQTGTQEPDGSGSETGTEGGGTAQTTKPVTKKPITQTTKPVTKKPITQTTKPVTQKPETPPPATEPPPGGDQNPVALGTRESYVYGGEVHQNSNALVDASNKARGIVLVKYLASGGALRVIIVGPGGQNVTYTLKNDGSYEAYPLVYGNGAYTVTVYKQIEGNRYSTVYRASINVSLESQFAPFLTANQYANYSKNSNVVKVAQSLVQGKSGTLAKLRAIYEYTMARISYDYNKAATVKSGYVPNPDEIIAARKGICFDYASVMVSMLRSQGIPAKMVFGDYKKGSGYEYHAWLSVYSSESGWMNGVISFDGKSWKLMDPTMGSASGSPSTYTPTLSRYTVHYTH